MRSLTDEQYREVKDMALRHATEAQAMAERFRAGEAAPAITATTLATLSMALAEGLCLRARNTGELINLTALAAGTLPHETLATWRDLAAGMNTKGNA